MFLASADSSDVGPLETLLERARAERTTTEQQNGAPAEVLAAWKTWYDEALDSANRLGGSSPIR
jgi:hypothetical protein